MTIQWSLVLFTVLAGCGAWLFACVAIDEFRGAAAKVRVPASVAAVVLLAVGGIASATHLSHVDRMMAALAHPAPGIFLEALLLGLLAVCAIVYAVLVARRAGAGARKAVAVAGIVLAVAFSFACGSSYMMSSRPAWNTVAHMQFAHISSNQLIQFSHFPSITAKFSVRTSQGFYDHFWFAP